MSALLHIWLVAAGRFSSQFSFWELGALAELLPKGNALGVASRGAVVLVVIREQGPIASPHSRITRRDCRRHMDYRSLTLILNAGATQLREYQFSTDRQDQ
jgi:hypothetical protein